MRRFVAVIMAVAMILCMCPPVFAEPKAYISYDFSDFDDIDDQYLYAIENALYMDILSGYPDGTFKPKNGLTRGAAAKIIANFNAQGDYQAKSAPFRDVSANHTFAGCIAYCVSRNIIGGYSDGTFQPASPLTGYAFAKMLLSDIEYAKDASRYTGSSWKSAVSADAAATGISELIPTLDKNITREEAAAMWSAAWNYEADHYDDDYDDWESEDASVSGQSGYGSPRSSEEGIPCTHCVLGGKCPTCRGNGVVDCRNCNWGDCPNCDRNGNVHSGVGSNYKVKKCTVCGGTHQCRNCRGKGELTCPECHGNMDCPICGGDQWI